MIKWNRKEARENRGPDKPRCSRCGHPGYTQGRSWVDGRPAFRCDKCGGTWTCGRDGGLYAKPPEQHSDLVLYGPTGNERRTWAEEEAERMNATQATEYGVGKS